MNASLIDINVEFLKDTKEYYAYSEFVNGAHAVGKTPQEGVSNLLDIVPTLIKLEKGNSNNTFKKSLLSNKLSFKLPITF